MKRLNDVCKWISVGAFILVGSATIILYFIYNTIPEELLKIIAIILTSLCLFIILLILISFIINIFFIMKRGFNNIKRFDDPIFIEIDRYRKCWNESKENYIMQIQIINLLYEKDGKVDELVKNIEIDRLYARADYLLTQINLYDDVTTYYSSLILSVIASFLCQMMEIKNFVVMIIWGFGIVVSFFMIVLIRYNRRGQDGSYRYYIEEYERKLLLEKIEN